MKTGAGENPFGREGDDGSDENADGGGDDEAGANDEETTAEATGEAAAEERSDAGSDSADGDAEPRSDEPDLPWAVRRDGPKSDRPQLIQMFAQEETKEREKRFRADVEQRLGNDVYKTDLREAAYLIAMEHPEEVAEKLGEWGCEHI